MPKIMPPETCHASPPCLLVGQDNLGNWVVQDEAVQGAYVFLDRAAALRFAMLNNGGRPKAVIRVPGVIEISGGLARARRLAAIDPCRHRSAASQSRASKSRIGSPG